jgi:hypothetical protein
MGRGGDGEMGETRRWGEGERGRWGDKEIGRQGDKETTRKCNKLAIYYSLLTPNFIRCLTSSVA